MNAEEQWWTEVIYIQFKPFTLDPSLRYYYCNICTVTFINIILFSYLSSVWLSTAILHVHNYVYKLQIFFLSHWFVINFRLTAAPCVLCVSILVGYDCHTVMFQWQGRTFFTGNRLERIRCYSSQFEQVNVGVAEVVITVQQEPPPLFFFHCSLISTNNFNFCSAMGRKFCFWNLCIYRSHFSDCNCHRQEKTTSTTCNSEAGQSLSLKQ